MPRTDRTRPTVIMPAMPATDADNAPRPIVILGNTAGGKSDLAAALAQQLDGEVLSADSMQVYKHMDVGTAKPPPEVRRRVEHHLMDIVEPGANFTVADWLEQCESLIDRLHSQGRRPIVVGGTNLYLKALLEGLFDAPGRDEQYRTQLHQQTPQELHQKLKTLDPPAAERIHPNDRQRLTRALEVIHLTGEPMSAQQTQWEDAGTPKEYEAATPVTSHRSPVTAYRHAPILLGLRWETDAINRRINRRVKAMFFPDKVEPDIAAAVCFNGESLPQEVDRLIAQGRLGPDDDQNQARQALGYKQVLAARAGAMSIDDAFEQTKIQTRRFAKQQRTWMKRFRGVRWIGMPDDDPFQAAMRAIA